MLLVFILLLSLIQLKVSNAFKNTNFNIRYSSHLAVSDPRELQENTISNSHVPRNYNTQIQRTSKSFISALALFTSTVIIASPRPVKANPRDESTYLDSENGFSVLKLQGWSAAPKQPPTISVGIGKLQLEEVLFVASSFLEGASISVTRTKVGRLLKDYDVAWWFAPLNTMKVYTYMYIYVYI
jgi:hypothetical protein